MNKNVSSRRIFLGSLTMVVLIGAIALSTGAQKPADVKPAPKAANKASAKPATPAKEVAPVVAEPTVAAPTAAEKAEYLAAYGWMVGQQAGFEMGFTTEEVDSIIKGLQRAAAGQGAPENMKEVFPKMQEYLSAKEAVYRTSLEAKMAEEAKVHVAEGEKFIASIATGEGVVKTASGLHYKILASGNATKPTEQDTVTIHYTGKLSDGTVFDSSVERGQPVDLPLFGVIPGFREGIQLLGEGGRAILYIPASIAYGSRAAGPIPPGSTLVFEVELIKVHPQASLTEDKEPTDAPKAEVTANKTEKLERK